MEESTITYTLAHISCAISCIGKANVCKQHLGSCTTRCIVSDWNVTCRKCKVNININKKNPGIFSFEIQRYLGEWSKVEDWLVTVWQYQQRDRAFVESFAPFRSNLSTNKESSEWSRSYRRFGFTAETRRVSIIEIREASFDPEEQSVKWHSGLAASPADVADNSAAFPKANPKARGEISRVCSSARENSCTDRESAVNSHQREKSGHLLLELRSVWCIIAGKRIAANRGRGDI